MTQPEFNAEEQYIIAYYLREGNATNWTEWILHGLMVALFAYGMYAGEQAYLVAAFGVVIFWHIYVASHQNRFFRSTRSVLQKYDDYVRGTSDPAEDEDG